ncbi:MAG TPA: GNAT family N-acetyltransferase [Anaerolineales bacterium]|nr:GNAT family N-acetyltransferase [Anaerolineales bacterium]HND49560.1 GNAT family N-acetyltransferase [Anaerolineales bacterium]
MISYVIRSAEPKDLPEIIQLCAEHAEFEQAEYSAHGKLERLHEHFFCATPSAFCLVAEVDKTLAGYATYSKEFSTWDAGFYIHMDCLFLRPSYRGYGIGEKLMEQICKEARRLGCTLIQWQTPKFNTRAIKFYERIGAKQKEKVRFYLNVD